MDSGVSSPSHKDASPVDSGPSFITSPWGLHIQIVPLRVKTVELGGEPGVAVWMKMAPTCSYV